MGARRVAATLQLTPKTSTALVCACKRAAMPSRRPFVAAVLLLAAATACIVRSSWAESAGQVQHLRAASRRSAVAGGCRTAASSLGAPSLDWRVHQGLEGGCREAGMLASGSSAVPCRASAFPAERALQEQEQDQPATSASSVHWSVLRVRHGGDVKTSADGLHYISGIRTPGLRLAAMGRCLQPCCMVPNPLPCPACSAPRCAVGHHSQRQFAAQRGGMRRGVPGAGGLVRARSFCALSALNSVPPPSLHATNVPRPCPPPTPAFITTIAHRMRPLVRWTPRSRLPRRSAATSCSRPPLCLALSCRCLATAAVSPPQQAPPWDLTWRASRCSCQAILAC